MMHPTAIEIAKTSNRREIPSFHSLMWFVTSYVGASLLYSLVCQAAQAVAMDSPFFNELVEKGANWKPDDNILADVAYGELREQSLDVYLPPKTCSEKEGEQDVAVSNETSKLPVWIHIHGGGWSRGKKDSEFYGGPGVCRTAVQAGFLSMSVEYRRGDYPGFMHDSANAIRWILKNSEKLGGDPSKIILSGHSAGGHIASLLMLRHDDFLRDVPKDYLRGAVLISGVYDLFCPLKSAPLDIKNKLFVAAYVVRVFGKNDALRRDASPLLLLDSGKDTSLLGSVPRSIRRLWSDSIRSNSGSGMSAQSYESTIDVNIELPSVLLLNAAIDMGLQENGRMFAAALKAHNVDADHHIIAGTDHASICWNKVAAEKMTTFAKEMLE